MGGFFDTDTLEVNRIEEARRRAAAGAGYIDLTGSNPTHQGFLFPAEILRDAAATYWPQRRYEPDPHGSIEARRAICQYYRQQRQGFVPEEDDIFITASTSEAYSLLFSLLSDPGDNILAPDVTYPLFEYLAAVHHVALRPYHLEDLPDWHIDGKSLLAAADAHTRALLLISPHNPTGMVIQRAIPELDRLRCPLICDEVFADFTFAVTQVPPLAALHPHLPVFHLNGISKMLALPDLKLGWIALNPEASRRYRKRLELLNDTFLGCNSLIQWMFPLILSQGQTFAQQMYRQVQANLHKALEILKQCPGIHPKPPHGGYYLFPEVDVEDEEELVIDLLQHGVFVYPGYFYAFPECQLRSRHIMISCLTQPDTLEQGLTRLCQGLGGER